MFKSKTKLLQLTVTLTACAFLLIPTLMSVLAGITVNYFKIAKMPPAVNPPITRIIILFPENTESVYLLQNLSI